MSVFSGTERDSAADIARIARKVQHDGFAFEESATILRHVGAGPGWDRLHRAWDDLPLDHYLHSGHRFRRRRYGRFHTTQGGDLRPRPHGPYFQTPETNPYAGGIDRHYQPIMTPTWQSGLFQALVALDTEIVSTALAEPSAWNADVHLFRIEASEGEPASPTPEGIHRDGNVAFAVHLFDYRCRGGRTSLYRGDEVITTTLAERGDTLIVDDRRLLHCVSDILPASNQVSGSRDVMIVDFYR
ncbi:2OG-Fe dioxygenase family protein [Nocardia jiangsuensis]|uniref:2OG-Fe dioxygenase family protein n=1 Tax=Nocardia jiangsuensis TaxID=1691563 RepID=A0ABV8E1F2_9NOCA